MSRATTTDLKALYGPGVGEALQDMQREQNESSVPMEADDSDYLTMAVKKRRQSAILKDVLKSGGYGDLAKMISIRKE